MAPPPDNRIGKIGATALADALEQCTSLKHVNLSCTVGHWLVHTSAWTLDHVLSLVVRTATQGTSSDQLAPSGLQTT